MDRTTSWERRGRPFPVDGRGCREAGALGADIPSLRPERQTTMNKQELIDSVADGAELTKADAGRAVDAVVSTISDALRAGEKVAITGFGSFEVRERAARTGRNPQTGATMQVPASKAPAFKAGKGLKDAVR
ncbi:MAG: HU family DNA-binding protein [Euzebyales bacterium]|nr:HU family DNA-binding protein [Euzebyales bacterium]